MGDLLNTPVTVEMVVCYSVGQLLFAFARAAFRAPAPPAPRLR